jgi:hypothetical protein
VTKNLVSVLKWLSRLFEISQQPNSKEAEKANSLKHIIRNGHLSQTHLTPQGARDLSNHGGVGSQPSLSMAMNTSSWRRKRENRGGKSDLERNGERLGSEIYLHPISHWSVGRDGRLGWSSAM